MSRVHDRLERGGLERRALDQLARFLDVADMVPAVMRSERSSRYVRFERVQRVGQRRHADIHGSSCSGYTSSRINLADDATSEEIWSDPSLESIHGVSNASACRRSGGGRSPGFPRMARRSCVYRGRGAVSLLPALRTVRAVLPHTALRSVVIYIEIGVQERELARG